MAAGLRETAGARADEIELGDEPVRRRRRGAAVDKRFIGADAAELVAADSLTMLRGDVDAMVDELQRRRDTFGTSYISVNAAFYEQLAPVVERPRRVVTCGRASGDRAVRGVDRTGEHGAAREVGVHARGGRPALGDRPHDERLAAAHVAADEDARRRWSCSARRARRCRARSSSTPRCRAAPRFSGPTKPIASSTSCAGQLLLGARDRLEPALGVALDLDEPQRAPRWPSLVADELAGGDRVDAARRPPRGPTRRGRSSGTSATASRSVRCSGGRGMISSWVTDAAPCRCAVPRQSAPVSPPPMMTTCLPSAVIGRRRRCRPAARGWPAAGTPSPGGRRRARARASAGRASAVAPPASTTASNRSRSCSAVMSAPTSTPARNSVPSARICSSRRSRWRFSILNSGMP